MRKSGFYPNLALTNILRNGQFYLPYFLTCTVTIGMFYNLCFLTYNDMIDTMPGAETLQTILYLGCIVVGLFSLAIVSYTNGFIMKRRRRELGLYNILGMEKRHIARLLCCESVLLGVGSLLCGLACGILLSKLILLFLLKLLHFTVKMGFSISGIGILVTCILFAAIFMLILLKNLFHIRLSKPVELLRSDAVGEREPKTKWIIAILGVLTLGGGYVIANVVKSPLQALLLFFVAVILVIIGTYCLFTAGSIALLKRLRSNKHYYYQAKHFTAVSGMLYRMKQNAAGLASICILSTMVLVTMSTTMCLYLGTERSLNTRYPSDILIATNIEKDNAKKIKLKTEKCIEDAVQKTGCTIKSVQAYTCLQFDADLRGDQLMVNPSIAATDSNTLQTAVIITADEYNRLSKQNVKLDQKEVLCYSDGTMLPTHFRVNDQSFTVDQRLKAPSVAGTPTIYADSIQYLVVADQTVLQSLDQLQRKAYGKTESSIQYAIELNLNGSAEKKSDCYQKIARSDISGTFSSRQHAEEVYMIYGGFLFLGLFLGLLFLIATVLIIYYKQISEGYEDQRRFEIMQKVGMSNREVRRTVHSQILLVFFLPLAMAAIHILAAYNMITRMLTVFALTDVHLFALYTVGTLLSFGAIYALVYWATARTYYRIVRARE